MAQRLEELGFDDVTILLGGFEAWREAGGPIEPRMGLAEEQPGA